MGQPHPSTATPVDELHGDVDVYVNDVDEIECTSSKTWRAWLVKNHSSKVGV